MKVRFKNSLILSLPCLMIFACGRKNVEIAVTNETGIDIGNRVIELDAGEVLPRINSEFFYVENEMGEEIPSQLTCDSRILFMADVKPGEKELFRILPSDTLRKYQSVAWGAFYHKRRDDVSYENEKVGFRIYGPGTQAAGEKSFGYDIFLKYPTEELIVPQLYAAETDDAVWARVDSLRNIDPSLADEYVSSFSYHIDHGKGMDCYAVGSTLGDGVAALMTDSIHFPWVYKEAQILDNGPIRFTLALDFPATEFKEDSITEHRLITLDKGAHLNDCKVWFEGLSAPSVIVTGFPRRDDAPAVMETDKGILAYTDPTQGPDNGKIFVGIKTNETVDSMFEKESHILLASKINPNETFNYNWGFAWSKGEIKTMQQWLDYLQSLDFNYTVKIIH